MALGAIFGQKVYTLKVRQILKMSYNIVLFEVVNILAMLRLWLPNEKPTLYCLLSQDGGSKHLCQSYGWGKETTMLN